MKQIQKTQQPKEFTEWKARQKATGVNYTYKDIPVDIREIVQISLLKEQGYICCYCCGRVEQNTSHIEHLNAQSRTQDNQNLSNLDLDYKNLLASCGSNSSHFPEHCGNQKNDREISITPLQQNCENFFEFSSIGEINPASHLDKLEEKQVAENTINILGLNNYRLKQSRKQVLEFIHNEFEGLDSSKAKRKARQYRQLNNDGKYEAFVDALSYYLKKHYKL